ncbi:MAG TPA: hypothetical protein VNH11_35815 [Pirellulales bacterium]|nr:hypothetical protein [Pirellulales bacterium]
MMDILSKFESGETIALVAVAGGLICGITAIVGGTLAKCWRQGREMALKEEMIERGMSADEIRTVIECGARDPMPGIGCHHAGPPANV